MSENPADEPTADEPADRSLSWWPLLAAAVVAAVFLTIIFTVGSDGDSGPGTERDDSGALACPKTYQRNKGDFFWVPADPSGVDGKKSLMPDTKPSHVTICSYSADTASDTTPIDLSGHRTLRGGSKQFATTLSEAKKAKINGVFSFDGPNDTFLVGATFATGYVWISVPGTGAGLSNGQFESDTQLLDRVSRAYASREWR